MTSITASERHLALAKVGLLNRIRPLCTDGVSVANALFAVEDDRLRGERALVVFQASFAALDPAHVASDDKKVYERELERRRKRLAKIAKQRDELLPAYAAEIIDSGTSHRALEAFDDMIHGVKS